MLELHQHESCFTLSVAYQLPDVGVVGNKKPEGVAHVSHSG